MVDSFYHFQMNMNEQELLKNDIVFKKCSPENYFKKFKQYLL